MAAIVDWIIPSGTNSNVFSVTLASNQQLTGVSLDDFFLMSTDGRTIEASGVSTLNRVIGTHNWRLDISLVGTFETQFYIRLRSGRVIDADNDAVGRITSGLFLVDSNFINLGIEKIDHQFIVIETSDYDLVIDVYGEPEEVDVGGLMEGFNMHYDRPNNQLHIRADQVTRLISEAIWNIKLTKDDKVADFEVLYSVIAPGIIVESLPLLHLYRQVQTRFNILIQNPKALTAESKLIGVKSESVDVGVQVAGVIPPDSDFTRNNGVAQLIVPDETGDTSTMYDFPYVIESGAPPQIGDIDFIPRGHYGLLEFDDLAHALGYEWTLETFSEDLQPDAWNEVGEARPPLNPRTVRVNPGDLSAEIVFDHVDGASAYEYSATSEAGDIFPQIFEGVVDAQGRITVVIPNLEDGVEYDVTLRVASPWIGSPISVKVFGGRLAYSVHDNRENSYLYIFHTGVRSGETAPLLKRILLPTGCTEPRGVAIHDDLAYVTNEVSRDRAVYVFNHENTNNGDRANIVSKFLLSDSTSPVGAIGVFGDELYVIRGSTRRLLRVYDRNSTNGQRITQLRDTFRPGNAPTNMVTISCLEHEIFVRGIRSGRTALASYDRIATDVHTPNYQFNPAGGTKGMAVVGDIFYGDQSTNFLSFGRNPEAVANSIIFKTFGRPPGLLNPVGLDIPSAREGLT